MAELHVHTQVVAGVPTIYLRGDFDSYSAPRVRTLLDELTAEANPQIRVHLAGLDYVDSTGLGVLVVGLKQATDQNGSLCLVAPPPSVERTLRITGLDRVFPIVAEGDVAPA